MKTLSRAKSVTFLPSPSPSISRFFGPRFNFRATTHDHAEMFIDTYSAIRRTFMRIQLFRETFLEKVHATIPKGIIVDGFWVHYSSEKFERMAREAMEVRLRVVNESNKSRFDS